MSIFGILPRLPALWAPFCPDACWGSGLLALLHSGVMAARAGLPPGTCSACPPWLPLHGDWMRDKRHGPTPVLELSRTGLHVRHGCWAVFGAVGNPTIFSILRSCGRPSVKGRMQAKAGAVSLPHLDVYSRLLFFDLICPGVRGRARAKASATSPSRLGRALLCGVLHTLRCGKVDTG